MQVKKTLITFLLVAFFLALIAWVAYYENKPSPFVLAVDNESGLLVDQVRLFGSALEQEAVLFNLEPGVSVDITVLVKPSGTLKFEVSQGLNRIDTFIVEDTLLLESFAQRLTIHPNNRFILAD